MLCETEITANSDAFELAVAQNTAIYCVFEPAVKKHCNCDVFNNMVAKNMFFLFRAKMSSLAMHKNIGNSMFFYFWSGGRRQIL